MARSVTLTQLLEDVRQRYDLPTWSSTTFVTQDAVTRMINNSIQALASIMIEEGASDWFTSTSTVTASASTSTTAEPTGLYTLKALFWERGTDDVVQMVRANVDELALRSYAATTWSTPKYIYRMGVFEWLPVPSENYTVRVYGTILPTDLSSGGDTFTSGPGWDEWIVMDVCSKIAQREEKDEGHWVAMRADAEQRIRGQLERHAGGNLQVREADDANYPGTRELRDLLLRGF